MTADRKDVYKALDSERDYQNMRWGQTKDEPTGHNPHSVTEWLVYMQHYVNEGLKAVTTLNDPEASGLGLEFVRKATALGVVCMEQNGAPQRKGFER